MALETTLDSPNVFRQYIERNAQYALLLLHAAEPPLSRKQLAVILQALQYTLSLKTLWSFSKQLLLTLAPQMELLDLRVIWRPYLEEGLRQSLEAGDQEAELALHYYLGNILRESNAYDEAIEHYERGIQLAKKLKKSQCQARLLNRYAFALRRKKLFGRAELCAKQALALAHDDPIERGYSNLVLGSIRYDQRRWDECLTFSYRALEIWKTHDARHELAWAYTNLGVALWRKGELDEAERHLEQGILYFEEMGAIVFQATAKLTLGAVLLEKEAPEKALIILAEAEKVFHAIRDRRRMAMAANNLAHAYQMLQQWEDAIDAFHQSIALWREMGEMAKALDVLHSLISLLIDIGEEQHARQLLQKGRRDLTALEGQPEYDWLEAEFERLTSSLTSSDEN
ncbi:MAG TPA: tetratricopeptide repeat protein [Anaerolineae bacterium]|nr:tetratricopeptide repeat protein [Anaerolineae bacterium]